MAKLMIVLIVGLGAAFYFPASRSIILDRAGFAVNPLYEWVTVKEMDRIAGDLARFDDRRRNFPNSREFQGWIRKQFQTDDTQYDAWGNPYWLETLDRGHARVCSAGPDGISDSDDDICYPPDDE